jgi:phosphate transport system substrate-binding protein
MQIAPGFARIRFSSFQQLTPVRCLLTLFTFAAAFSFPQFSPAQETVALVGSGSSVPAPLYTKWAEEYNKRTPKIQMRYLPLGTSEGINQISHGNGDFAAGEVPLSAKERSEGSLIEIPSVVIAIVPIYNLPGTQGELRFSGTVLADIFLGRVKTWNSPALAKINPHLSLPDLPIKVIYRPAGKGSNYVFSDFLSKTSPAFREEIGTSPSPKWPIGSPAERSSDMVEKVRSEPGSIGYVEVQYAVKMNMPYGSVLNAAGHYVKASDATLTAACTAVEAPSWIKLSASLANAPGAQSFPITSFSWLYLRTASHDSGRKAALSDLLNWMFTSGQQIADHEGYSELPPPLLAKVRAKIDSLK